MHDLAETQEGQALDTSTNGDQLRFCRRRAGQTGHCRLYAAGCSYEAQGRTRPWLLLAPPGHIGDVAAEAAQRLHLTPYQHTASRCDTSGREGEGGRGVRGVKGGRWCMRELSGRGGDGGPSVRCVPGIYLELIVDMGHVWFTRCC